MLSSDLFVLLDISAPGREVGIVFLYSKTYKYTTKNICLTSASARNSESQRIDASSLIFQLMYKYTTIYIKDPY